jgi:2-keto-3-deoxy-L-rhamnonate aldolase RhmA
MPSPFTLKRRLAAGETIVGSWLSFDNTQMAEMMARTGFDFLTIDMEHGHASNAGLLSLIQTIELAGTTPLVRLASNEMRQIKTAMDAGAHGIIVPDVRSAEEARRAGDAIYYPPQGRRGVGLSRAQGFGFDFDAYKKERLPNAILVVQIEHHQAVADLEAILDVETVDAFIIGPYDLSGSIGRPGEFEHPDVVALLDKTEDVIRHSKKPGGFHIVNSDEAAMRKRIAGGCRFMAYGTEMIFLGEKLRDAGAFLDTLRKPPA